eukprot:scaffold121898_cov42-Attheya_sp.AAC.1
MKERRSALDIHRLNYGPEEPHLDKQPNSHMTPDQVETAALFLDELIDLGVLVEESHFERIKATIPLFLVDKPGNENLWRVIADCKAGGQNAYVAKDPVHLYAPQDVLPQLYTAGGWSAVSDASKYFHLYPTTDEDRPFLVVLHPKTLKYYVLHGLPMGAGNSPVAAGAGGNGALQGEPYDPLWSHSRILIGKDGLPSARIWVHVDDFLIHAPTRAKCNEALSAFMDHAVNCGLLCNKKKTKPPAQRQDYVGFTWDTSPTPRLIISDAKKSRELAVLQFLRSHPPD